MSDQSNNAKALSRPYSRFLGGFVELISKMPSMAFLKPLLVIGSLFFSICSFAEETNQCLQVAELIPHAETLRGLAKKAPLKCEVLPESVFNDLAEKRTRELNRPERIHYEEILYKIIGLIPDSYPYLECVYDASGSSTWAMYDRETKRIVLKEGTSTPPWVLIHEIVHALQDQHFNIRKMRSQIRSSDEELAISALIEGDAIRIEELFRERFKETHLTSSVEGYGDGYDARCRPPDALFDIYMFVYEWGARFVGKLPVTQIDQAFKDPPRTSREILFPQEYLSRSSRAPLPKTAIDTANHLLLDTLGEFILRALLKKYVSHPKAILGAKGLRHDRILLFRSGETFSVKWQLDFADTNDITQLLLALSEYAESRFGINISPHARRMQLESKDHTQFEVSTQETTALLRFSHRLADKGHSDLLTEPR